MIEQIELRFNKKKKTLEIIKSSALLETFGSLITISEEDVSKTCLYFPSLKPANVRADLNSFE